MNAWMLPLAGWLLDFSLLASVALAAALALRWCFRDAAPRVALAWGTWLGLVALAIVTALPQWPRVTLWPAASNAPAVIVVAERLPAPFLVDPAILPEANLPALATEHPAEIAADANHPWRTALVLSWLALAVVAALWIVMGLWQTGRLIRRAVAAPPWIAGELQQLTGKRRKPPQVRTSQRLSSAAAVGAVAPKILLPQSAATEDQRSLVRAALAHEWAHISRGDLWLLALERLLLPLLAWQPLFWWLRRSVRLDLELLADSAAAGERPIEYAEALLAWAKTAGPAPAGLAALSLWESHHSLSRRVTMLLDPKRPIASRATRGWQLFLVLAALGLVAGLSPFSLRPRTTDAQEPVATRAEDKPSVSINFTDKQPAQIVMKCLVLEADRTVLSEIMPVEDRPQPSPETDIAIRSPKEWELTLEKLKASPGTEVISRPKVLTLDGQVAEVQMLAAIPPAPPADPVVAVEKPKQVGWKIRMTPHLIQDGQTPQRVKLQLDAEQLGLSKSQPGEFVIVERRVVGGASVPVGEVVIIASRPTKPELRPLVMAVEVQLVQLGESRLAQEQPSAPALDQQSVVQQLKRALAERSREVAVQRDQSEALRRQVEELKAQLDKLSAGERVSTVFRLHHAKATDAEKALQLLLEQAIALGGDPQIKNVQVVAEARTNSLIVAAPQKYSAPIQAIIAKLDQPALAKVATADPAALQRDPNLISNQKGVLDRLQLGSDQILDLRKPPSRDETQLQLAKLDVQEAEIGVQAAKRDLDRVRALYERSAVSQDELSKHEFQLQAAEIKLQRTKIILEGMMRQSATPLLNAVDGPMPPHLTPHLPR